MTNSPAQPLRRRSRVPLVFVAIVVLIAVFYGIEHWRGLRAWKKHERELIARRVPLDLKALIPKAVPDEQNFAATPFVQSWFVRGTSESNVWKDGYVAAAEVTGKPQPQRRRTFIDLQRWQHAFAARESLTERVASVTGEKQANPESRRKAAEAILHSMRDSDATLSELHAASARPHAVYPIKYQDDVWGILLPHLRYLKSACLRLQLRACAALAIGQADAAHQDLMLMLYLADSIQNEPLLISFLVRGNCRELAAETVWEGLAQRAWSETQLQQLQSRLLQYDYRVALKRALDGEHAGGLMTPALVRRYGVNYLLALADTPQADHWSKPMSTVAGFLIPTGWVCQEQLNYSRFFWMQLGPLLDENGAMKTAIPPVAVRTSTAEAKRNLKVGLFRVLWEHKLFAGFFVPGAGRAPFRAAKTQISTDQAALACALERYRIANGHFPDRLEALVPQFIDPLPKDILSGGPCNYRRTDGGQFILYSVGWNERDDGGTPGKELYDENDGDWIWSCQ